MPCIARVTDLHALHAQYALTHNSNQHLTAVKPLLLWWKATVLLC